MQNWMIVQTVFFIAGSAALIYVSRKPLLHPRSHGFFRFFAWEAILGLVVLNLPVWFRDPFSPLQIISWLLLILSAFLVLHGVHLLDVVGKSGTRASTAAGSGEANYQFENTSQLVKVGAYKYIRHPLYASLLYLAWGAFLKQPTALLGLVLALAASIFLWLTARMDEEECKRAFGKEYEVYIKATRMFIPYIL